MPEPLNDDQPNIRNYASNSQRARKQADQPQEQERRVEKLISGQAVQRKKPLSRKIAETFTGDDAQSVGNYILFDVIIPATKNLISDMVREGIDRFLFGAGPSRGRGLGPGNRLSGNFTNYSKMYTGGSRMDVDRPDGGRRVQRDEPSDEWSEVVVTDRGEADLILEKLYEIGEEYGFVRVTDLKDSLGLSTTHIDNIWGWEDLRGSEIRHVREGYLIQLPKPMPLN